MNLQQQVLGHAGIRRFARGVEASRGRPGEYDVMNPIRGEFSGQRVFSWVTCC